MTTGTPEFDPEDKLRAMHHFVPQSYLKRFSRPDRPTQIYAYEIDREPYSPNIEGIAGQRDFYTYTDTETNKETAALENALADIDDKGAAMLRVLDEKADGYVELTDEQKGNLFYYIAMLHTRNLQQRKYFADMYSQMSQLHVQTYASDKDSFHKALKDEFGDQYDHDEMEKSRQNILNGEMKINFDPLSEHFLGATLENAQHLYAILMKLKKPVLLSVTSGNKRFVTSDNPVTHYLENGDPRRVFGVGYVNAIFQLPISPTRCLILIDDSYVIDDYECDEDVVDHMNFYTYRYADRWIFSHVSSSGISEMFNKHKAKEPLMRMSSPFGTSDQE